MIRRPLRPLARILKARADGTDPDRIEAEMRGGVLTLTLPRAPEAQRKRIAVKGA